MLVFDNFPAEKAKDLMQIASKGTSIAQNLGFVPSSSKATAEVDHSKGLSNETPVSVSTPANPSVMAQGEVQKPAQPNASSEKSLCDKMLVYNSITNKLAIMQQRLLIFVLFD